MRLALVIGLCAAQAGCHQNPCQPGGDSSYLQSLYPTLDQYCMVSLENGAIVPKDGVTPYDLNTPLFSDSAVKFRTVWTPAGASADYDDTNVLALPVGTVLTKSFGFPDDLRKPEPTIRWVETRVLVHQPSGWKGVSYAWDEAQQTATVNYGGGLVPLSWTDEVGNTVTPTYVVPNGNQCVECHAVHDVPMPIGPTVRNLNKTFHYATGDDNQLAHWTQAGLLSGAPADPGVAPKLAAAADPSSGTVDERARAYLEANCAHCHSDGGFARTTGLYLRSSVTEATQLGVCKPPVAVGEATGGFLYDVVPGDPDHSILTFRMASTAPSVMMPQIGRSIVDTAGVQLVRDYVSGLTGSCR
jgi:uncharacterized repeat protein (TIGR03806 family)